MAAHQEERERELYNLILNPKTRDWERSLLLAAKQRVSEEAPLKEQLWWLEAQLRPLASRNNLTPDVADFYSKITGESVGNMSAALTRHYAEDGIGQERAIFAGGCFWCMVEPFETHPGILSVLSGYTGGTVEQPSYDQVSGGYTGHVEAVEIIFDPQVIGYGDLVELYWQLTDPTDAFGQFQDRGDQYRPIIFFQNDAQKHIAEASKQRLSESGAYKKPIVTKIQPAGTFWPAENYHQQFYQKQPKRYKGMKHTRQQMLFYQRLMRRLHKIRVRWLKHDQ